MELFTASRQWAERPADQRFWTVEDMERACAAYASAAVETEPIRRNRLRFMVDAQGDDVALDPEKLGGSGGPIRLTHHTFGQVASGVGAPAEYLRRLPTEKAVELLNWHHQRDEEDVNRVLLIHPQNGNGRQIARAATSERYMRVWNWSLLNLLRQHALPAGWRVPPGRSPGIEGIPTRRATSADVLSIGAGGGAKIEVGDEIAPSGLYASDHDMFAFLINPNDPIESPGGKGGPLYRGVMLGNSEVGGESFWLTFFLFQGVCGNHIVWGASGVREFRFAHVGKRMGARVDEAVRTLHAPPRNATLELESGIRLAASTRLGQDKDEVVKNVWRLRLPLSQANIEDAYTAVDARRDEFGDPRTAWGVAQGLTLISQRTAHADKRQRIDDAAGTLLATIGK